MSLADKVVTVMNLVPSPIAGAFRSDARLARVFRPLVNRLVPAGPTWIVVRSGPAKGVQLLIYPKTEKLFWHGRHEDAVQQAVANFLRPGAVFWDVGAHIGFFTFLASRVVGEAGQVRAFEPEAHNRECLLAGARRNGCNNIIMHDCALSATQGEGMLYANESSAMWTLVVERGQRQGAVVRCRTLDEFAEVLPPPDLIKIDVEGAELDVLRGGAKFLATLTPRLIVEFSDDDLLAQARALLPFYTFELLGQNHWLAQSRADL